MAFFVVHGACCSQSIWPPHHLCHPACLSSVAADQRKQDLQLLEAAPPDEGGGGGSSRGLMPYAKDADDADADADDDDSSSDDVSPAVVLLATAPHLQL